MKEICLRIKKIRIDKNLNQIEFAKRLGVTNSHISGIEKGKTMPSPALIKLISKEFMINERWLVDGIEPVDLEDAEEQTENTFMAVTERLNKIITRDVLPIRSRVAQIQDLFVNILDLSESSESTQAEYLDICYKIFYHINGYLSFQKKACRERQTHIFPFPDDLSAILERDIDEFESFFKKLGAE